MHHLIRPTCLGLAISLFSLATLLVIVSVVLRNVPMFSSLVNHRLSQNHVQDSVDDDSKGSSDTTTKPLCTLEMFKQINNQAGYVQSSGWWHRNESGEILEFRPDVCSFKYDHSSLPVTTVNKCFTDKNVRKIVILGDSNGQRYAINLLLFLAENGYQCKALKYSGTVSAWINGYSHFRTTEPINENYFATKQISSSMLHGFGTNTLYRNAYLMKCTPKHKMFALFQYRHTVFVEYLYMEYTRDNQLVTTRVCDDTACIDSRSTQEYYFREYLHDGAAGGAPPPDLVLWFGNSHDKRRMSVREFADALRYTMALADDLLPNSTFIWFSKPYENGKLKPDYWRIHTFYGLDYNEWENQTNSIMFKQLKRYYNDGKKFFPFLDLQAMGKSVADDVGTDGIHMKAIWYQHIVSYVLQAFCEKYL